ncbi:NUDIX domain-containing protein [Candidatus Woesearchaeota archaeon]|nr:NUDIX domain-containing protein [Candidatus Woesearchaeota archaeon]
MKTDLVVAGFIFRKNKVLLVHHKKLNLWLPVGGHINLDETPDDALLREIREETGVDAVTLNKNETGMGGNVKNNLAVPFHVNVHSAGDHNHCCFFYVCKAKNKNIKINDELKGFKWLAKEGLDKDYIPKDVREIGLKAFEMVERLDK